MKFGSFPLEQCKGAILAHSLRLDGFAIKKGTVLRAEQLDELRKRGISDLTVARLEADDVIEDEAALELAKALKVENIRIEKAGTGRVNMFATCAGILDVSKPTVDRINSVDPAMTLATLARYEPVATDRMVATVKIIPYAVSRKSLVAASSVAATACTMSVRGFESKRVGVISTRLPHLRDQVIRKTISILDRRLAPSGSRVVEQVVVEHSAETVRDELLRQISHCDMLIVFGASAISDENDIIPAAILAAGGRVERFGMPVDPGNLLLLGDLKGKPVIGAPGCARSPAENGFDFVLARLLAGVPVSSQEISEMGVGGLLMEIGSRPQPRENIKDDKTNIAAIIMAAGQSRRMGTANKLLEMVNGKPVIRHVVDAALSSRCSRVVVVTGHESEKVREALPMKQVTIAHNPDFAHGLSTSLRAGIRALKPQESHALVLLGDMPEITAEMIDQMVERQQFAPPGSVILATDNGKRGNPVLWPKSYFDALASITGDTGARHIFAENPENLVEVELGSAAGLDIDTVQALENYRNRQD